MRLFDVYGIQSSLEVNMSWSVSWPSNPIMRRTASHSVYHSQSLTKSGGSIRASFKAVNLIDRRHWMRDPFFSRTPGETTSPTSRHVYSRQEMAPPSSPDCEDIGSRRNVSDFAELDCQWPVYLPLVYRTVGDMIHHAFETTRKQGGRQGGSI